MEKESHKINSKNDANNCSETYRNEKNTYVQNIILNGFQKEKDVFIILKFDNIHNGYEEYQKHDSLDLFQKIFKNFEDNLDQYVNEKKRSSTTLQYRQKYT